jgi:hypothetical protein
MNLANGMRTGSLDGEAHVLDETRQVQCVEELIAEPASGARITHPVVHLHEGALLSGRYRILHRIAGGWLAFDERLSRPVFVAALVGQGDLPAERVRREAARGVPLVDAIIAGEAAFAVRAMSHTT